MNEEKVDLKKMKELRDELKDTVKDALNFLSKNDKVRECYLSTVSAYIDAVRTMDNPTAISFDLMLMSIKNLLCIAYASAAHGDREAFEKVKKAITIDMFEDIQKNINNLERIIETVINEKNENLH